MCNSKAYSEFTLIASFDGGSKQYKKTIVAFPIHGTSSAQLESTQVPSTISGDRFYHRILPTLEYLDVIAMQCVSCMLSFELLINLLIAHCPVKRMLNFFISPQGQKSLSPLNPPSVVLLPAIMWINIQVYIL